MQIADGKICRRRLLPCNNISWSTGHTKIRMDRRPKAHGVITNLRAKVFADPIAHAALARSMPLETVISIALLLVLECHTILY